MTTTPEEDAVMAQPSPAEVPVQPSLAPVPSARTVRQRTSLPLQAYRFAAVSLRMVTMIRRSHH